MREKTISSEENLTKFDASLTIQQICEERGITTLIHFTRIENLQNILQEGLLGRSFLEERRQEFLFNDNDRADGHKEAVCLSISFPNYQMFYRIREKKRKEKLKRQMILNGLFYFLMQEYYGNWSVHFANGTLRISLLPVFY